MTSDEERTLAELLSKKKAEEEARAPVLQLIPGGGEKNAMADKLSGFATMARQGLLFDYAIVVVKADGQTMMCAWGSAVPSLQICAGTNALNVQVVAALQRS